MLIRGLSRGRVRLMCTPDLLAVLRFLPAAEVAGELVANG